MEEGPLAHRIPRLPTTEAVGNGGQVPRVPHVAKAIAWQACEAGEACSGFDENLLIINKGWVKYDKKPFFKIRSNFYYLL